MQSNRGDIDGMTALAHLGASQSGSPVYLVATAFGYVLETLEPDRKHLRVEPNGEVWQVPEQTKHPIPGADSEPRLIAVLAP